MKSLWSALSALGLSTRARIKTFNRKARRHLRAFQRRAARAAGLPTPPSLATQGVFGLEELEQRQVLSASVVTHTDDLNVAVNTASTTIDLTGRLSDDAVTGTVVRISTTYGSFDIALSDNATPLTVANFLAYVNSGVYDDTIFHRSVSAFVLQTGGYSKIADPHITTSPAVPNEFGASNLRGTVAMAKVGTDPNSATSEWFVNLNDNSANLDNQNGGFTVFGTVLGNGMAVVDKLAAVRTFNEGGSFTQIPLKNYYKGFPVFKRNYLRVISVNEVPVMPTSDSKDALLKLSVTSSNPGLVKANLEDSNLTLKYAHGKQGRAVITIRSIDLSDGSIVEDSFVVTVGTPTGSTISVSAGNATRVEGDAGESAIAFTLSLSVPATERVSIQYFTSDRSATSKGSGGDYKTTKGTVWFEVGQTTAIVSVPVRGDTAVEKTENFAIILTKPTGNLVIAETVGIGTITNDDAPTFTTVKELTGNGQNQPVTISYQTLLDSSDASRENGSPIFRVELRSTGTLTKGGVDATAGTTIGPGESLIWTPAMDAHGDLNAFTIKAVSNDLVSASAVQVKVNINDVPTLTTVATLAGGTEDNSFTITYAMLAAAGNEMDLNGDPIKFRIDSVATGTTLTKDGKPVVANTTLIGPGESLVWTPAANASGDVAAFKIRASDGTTVSATSVQVTVNLAPVNDAPSLANVTTLNGATAGTAFTISYDTLLAAADESDPDSGTTFSFRIEQVSSGTLTKNGTAVTAGTTLIGPGDSVVWTPAIGNSGVRSAFKIIATDGSAFSDKPVQVSVQVVSATNAAPTLTSVSPLNGASEDTNFNISYNDLIKAANEADPDHDTVSFVIHDVLTGTLLKNGVAIVPDTTTIGPGDVVVWKGDTDASGLLSAFTIVASDGVLSSATPVIVKVQTAAVNDRPTLTSVTPLTGATEDQPFTITYDMLAANGNEADVDSPGQLSFRVSAVTSGTLTKNGTAVVAGSTLLGPGESLVWTPAANANGSIGAFTIVAFDGALASTTAISVVVAVGAVNDAPTLTTVAPLLGASANTPYVVKFSDLLAAANEADTDPSTTFSFRIESVTTGTLTKNGVAVVSGTIFSVSDTDGSWVWTPATDASGLLNAFKIVAWDGNSPSTPAVQVTVQTVAANNHAPTLTSVSTLSVATEDTAFTVTYAALISAANETDQDVDTLAFKISAVTSGTLTKNGVAVVPGTTLLQAGETLQWKPDLNANGVLNAFTVVVTDGVLDSDTPVQVKVQTAAINDAPTLTAITALTGATEDTPFTITYQMLADAADEADVDSTNLSFRISAVSTGTLTKNGVAIVAGTTTLGPGETVRWTPALNANGNVNAFTVVAFDGSAASATAVQVTVAVTAVNDAPTLTTVNTLFGAVAGTEYSISFANLLAAANEADVDGSTTFTFRIESVPNGTLSKNGQPVNPGETTLAAGESLVWTPDAANSGPVNAFTIVASDGTARSTPAVPVTIQTVGSNNHAPTLTTINVLTGASEDTPFGITYAQLAAAANEADADGDVILFKIDSITGGTGSTLTLNGATAVAGSVIHPGDIVTWTGPTNVNGTLTAFSVVAFDGALESTAAVAVQVVTAAVNDRPTITTITTLDNGIEDQPYTITYATLLGAATDAADVDSPTISFRVAAISSGTLTKNGIAVTPGTTTLGPGESFVWTPAANANGTLNAFTVNAFDGLLASTTAPQVRVIVAAQPDAPTLTAINTLFSATAGQPFTITFEDLLAAGNEADADGVTTFTFRIGAVSSGSLTKNGDAVVGGTTTLVAGESLVWTPATGASGLVNAFTVVVMDAQNNASTPAVSVKVQTVTPTNHAPTLTTINTISGATEDTSFLIGYESLAAAANEADADGNTILFRFTNVASGTLTKNGAAVVPGVTTIGPGESVVWVPAANANGTLEAFSVVATDGVASSDPAVVVRIETSAVNDKPTLTTVNQLTGALQDTPFTITYQTLADAADEADIDTFGQLSFSIQSVSAGLLTKNGVAVTAGVTLLGPGESLVWTPPASVNGAINAFNIAASDGALNSSPSVAVSINITPAP